MALISSPSRFRKIARLVKHWRLAPFQCRSRVGGQRPLLRARERPSARCARTTSRQCRFLSCRYETAFACERVRSLSSGHALFLSEHADGDEGKEVREVLMPVTNWTREQGVAGNSAYTVHYPGQPELRGPDYQTALVNFERVVVLSCGPTNLLYET